MYQPSRWQLELLFLTPGVVEAEVCGATGQEQVCQQQEGNKEGKLQEDKLQEGEGRCRKVEEGEGRGRKVKEDA